ncbi:MAG TPA: hypothetical protein VIR03_01855 [Candidatus Saccharimonadales bacterium]
MSKPTTLYCFSPPVMIATFVIEASLFVYTVVRYRLAPVGRIVAAMLACLAIFQLAEYNVCGHDLMPAGWSRVGYVAITLLPALGVHLVQAIAGRRAWLSLIGAYGSSAAFALIFGLNSAAFQGHVCGGNYAVFQLMSPLGGVYFFYYYFWLFIGIAMAWMYSRTAKPNIRKAQLLQILGYFSFIIPTSVVNAINPQTLDGIPSIMCGFAVTYALILSFGVVPLVSPQHTQATKRHSGHKL